MSSSRSPQVSEIWHRLTRWLRATPVSDVFEMDADGIRRRGAMTGEVQWRLLVQVVATTGEHGVELLLRAGDGGACRVPASHPQARAVLDRLQRLPRFGDQTWALLAVQGAQRGAIVCWDGSEGEGAAAGVA